MSYQLDAHTIKAWFDRADRAQGPVFPDGWFGRPYDNLWTLENVEYTAEHLRVVFQCGRVLHFEGPLTTTDLGRGLMFVGFSRCAFFERNSDPPNRLLADHQDGVVLLVAPQEA